MSFNLNIFIVSIVVESKCIRSTENLQSLLLYFCLFLEFIITLLSIELIGSWGHSARLSFADEKVPVCPLLFQYQRHQFTLIPLLYDSEWLTYQPESDAEYWWLQSCGNTEWWILVSLFIFYHIDTENENNKILEVNSL
jgi:hypothetical protein